MCTACVCVRASTCKRLGHGTALFGLDLHEYAVGIYICPLEEEEHYLCVCVCVCVCVHTDVQDPVSRSRAPRASL